MCSVNFGKYTLRQDCYAALFTIRPYLTVRLDIPSPCFSLRATILDANTNRGTVESSYPPCIRNHSPEQEECGHFRFPTHPKQDATMTKKAYRLCESSDDKHRCRRQVNVAINPSALQSGPTSLLTFPFFRPRWDRDVLRKTINPVLHCHATLQSLCSTPAASVM